MTKIFQLGLLFLGALALSFTLATAEGKCGADMKKELNSASAKCGNATKEMKCQAGKCGSDTKNETKMKPTEKKGKCGQGKCGS